MKRIPILISMAFLVLACGGPATPTPDVVATEVAQAGGGCHAHCTGADCHGNPIANLHLHPGTRTPTSTSTATFSRTPTPTRTPTHTHTPTHTPTPVPEAVVQIDTLNVRSGPGTDYDAVGKVSRGDKLKLAARPTIARG